MNTYRKRNENNNKLPCQNFSTTKHPNLNGSLDECLQVLKPMRYEITEFRYCFVIVTLTETRLREHKSPKSSVIEIRH